MKRQNWEEKAAAIRAPFLALRKRSSKALEDLVQQSARCFRGRQEVVLADG